MALPVTSPTHAERLVAFFEQQLWAICQPYVGTIAPGRRFPRRLVFVVVPGIPVRNNVAECRVRPLVIARKIRGDFPVPQGLGSLSGTSQPLRHRDGSGNLSFPSVPCFLTIPISWRNPNVTEPPLHENAVHPSGGKEKRARRKSSSFVETGKKHNPRDIGGQACQARRPESHCPAKSERRSLPQARKGSWCREICQRCVC